MTSAARRARLDSLDSLDAIDSIARLDGTETRAMVEVWGEMGDRGCRTQDDPLPREMESPPAIDRSIADLARRLASLSRAHDHGVHHAVRRSR